MMFNQLKVGADFFFPKSTVAQTREGLPPSSMDGPYTKISESTYVESPKSTAMGWQYGKAYRVKPGGYREVVPTGTSRDRDDLKRMKEGRAARDAHFVPSYCNHPHNLKTGRPIRHQCRTIPPATLRKWREQGL